MLNRHTRLDNVDWILTQDAIEAHKLLNAWQCVCHSAKSEEYQLSAFLTIFEHRDFTPAEVHVHMTSPRVAGVHGSCPDFLVSGHGSEQHPRVGQDLVWTSTQACVRRRQRCIRPGLTPHCTGLSQCRLASRRSSLRSIGCRHMTLHIRDAHQDGPCPARTRSYMPVYLYITSLRQAVQIRQQDISLPVTLQCLLPPLLPCKHCHRYLMSLCVLGAITCTRGVVVLVPLYEMALRRIAGLDWELTE